MPDIFEESVIGLSKRVSRPRPMMATRRPRVKFIIKGRRARAMQRKKLSTRFILERGAFGVTEEERLVSTRTRLKRFRTTTKLRKLQRQLGRKEAKQKKKGFISRLLGR